jgi:hypothetical protein
VKRKPPAAPPSAKSAPAAIVEPNPARANKIRNKLRKALDDPDMREQMVRALRQFMAEEK